MNWRFDNLEDKNQSPSSAKTNDWLGKPASFFVLGLISGIVLTLLSLLTYRALSSSSSSSDDDKNRLGNNVQITRFKNSRDLDRLNQGLDNNLLPQTDDQEELPEDFHNQMNQMRNKMLQLFQNQGNPTVDLGDNLTADLKIGQRKDDNNYYIDIGLSNVDKNTMNVEAKDGYLIIEGEMKQEEKGDHFQSMVVSSFSRSFSMPSDANLKKLKIDQKDQTLVITIPKSKR